MYMKIIPFVKNFEKKHLNATLVIGALVGVGVGMFLFGSLVPDSSRFNSAYSMMGNKEYDTRGGYMMNRGMYGDRAISARLSSSNISNEKQFLNEMIAQSQSSIRMAHQVLSLEGISDTTMSLAQDVIDSQTSEISLIQSILTSKAPTVNVKIK